MTGLLARMGGWLVLLCHVRGRSGKQSQSVAHDRRMPHLFIGVHKDAIARIQIDFDA